MNDRSGPSQAALPLSRLRRVLVMVFAVVIYAGLTIEFLDDVVEVGDLGELHSFFSLSHEQNLPTWVSGSLLFGCAVTLVLIASDARRRGSRWVRHWWVLSLIFFYISLDEFASLHENANHWFHLHGVLYFGWVIPAAILVGIVGLSYLRFLGALPARTRWQFLRAGAVYVGGALGVELLLAWWTDRVGDKNFVYALIDLVEESMEMIGVGLFLLALLEYLGGPAQEFRIRLGSPSSAASSPAEAGPGEGSGSGRARTQQPDRDQDRDREDRRGGEDPRAGIPLERAADADVAVAVPLLQLLREILADVAVLVEPPTVRVLVAVMGGGPAEVEREQERGGRGPQQREPEPARAFHAQGSEAAGSRAGGIGSSRLPCGSKIRRLASRLRCSEGLERGGDDAHPVAQRAAEVDR